MMYEITIKRIEKKLNSSDIIKKQFTACGKSMCILYVDGMVDKQLLETGVIRPLQQDETTMPMSLDYLNSLMHYAEDIKLAENIDGLCDSIAAGDIAFLIEDQPELFILSLKKYHMRSIAEPPTESILKGPREGFIEDVKVNITLLRKRLRTQSFHVRQLTVGKYSRTTVAVAYLDGIADMKVVQTIIDKIDSIDIDGIIDSSYIARFIEERKYSIFNQVGHIEKPDIVMSKLLEGRVAVLVDGSPIVLTLPYLMMETFQDSYDYYTRDFRSSFLRVIRLLGALITILLPGLFVAMQEYHYHLLPLKFLISIMNSVSGIPFTPPMEMMLVLVLFEILHQASIRMPRYVGIALSVVGAIVLGETAVNAGLISSPAVLIIAISAIGINCVPDSVDAFSILRLIVLLVGSVLGMYGIILMGIIVIAYLCSIQNYGAPYLAPFAPIIESDLKDGLLKHNLIEMEKRPYSLPNKNRHRLKIKEDGVNNGS